MSQGADCAPFHPTINRHSRRLASGFLPVRERHVQSAEVRRRVQGLWRAHAGIGSGEMLRGGVLAALGELGVPAASPVAEKFVRALGLSEETGVRCVAYDRFSMVLTAVLRAGLQPAQREESAVQSAVPTMRGRSASNAGHKEGRRVHADAEMHKISDDEKPNEDSVDKSPSPVAPRPRVRRAKRPSSIVSRPSINKAQQAHVQARVANTKQKTAPYDPLAGCTFAPAVNKTYRRPATKSHSESGQSSKAKSIPKRQEERELEHCTFAPNTAQFHAQRDSLAWWTRESFSASKDREVPMLSAGNSSTQMEKPTPTCGPASATPLAAGFDKAVRRMIDARQNSKRGFEESLRNSSRPYSNDDSAERVVRPPAHTVVAPFTLRSEERVIQREKQRPLLYVDVDLPSGRSGRIGVHRGDKPEALAATFAQAYGLGDDLRNRLEHVLREQLHARLQKEAPTVWL